MVWMIVSVNGICFRIDKYSWNELLDAFNSLHACCINPFAINPIELDISIFSSFINTDIHFIDHFMKDIISFVLIKFCEKQIFLSLNMLLITLIVIQESFRKTAIRLFNDFALKHLKLWHQKTERPICSGRMLWIWFAVTNNAIAEWLACNMDMDIKHSPSEMVG